jgi:hypothetical protein
MILRVFRDNFRDVEASVYKCEAFLNIIGLLKTISEKWRVYL